MMSPEPEGGGDWITDLEEIRRLAERNQDETLDFRVAVKGSLDWSSKKLNRTVKETVERVWDGIDCTACANCCRTLDVVLQDDDVPPLARRLGISEEEFLRRYTRKGKMGDLEFAGKPCPFLQGNLCSVYEDRPKTCSEYPYLHKDFRQRALTHLNNAAICPIVFNTLEELKDIVPWE